MLHALQRKGYLARGKRVSAKLRAASIVPPRKGARHSRMPTKIDVNWSELDGLIWGRSTATAVTLCAQHVR
jgi:hypothetical protein